MTRRIKVLVVDDSATVRAILSRQLALDPEVEVYTARDGPEALERIDALRPDVVTLDVAMPGMDGLQVLERIMSSNPLPVVMVSVATREGADVTIKALELGAVDFVLKPTYENVSVTHEIVAEVRAKVKMAARTNVRRVRSVAANGARPNRPAAISRDWRKRTIIIGASTGGPQALRLVLTSLPADIGSPILLVQHMPEGFTRPLAESLNAKTRLLVEEAREGSELKAGCVLVAPGGMHTTFTRGGRIKLDDGPKINGVRPSIDAAMVSAAEICGAATLGVILTGMGSDGTRGSAAIKAAGGMVIAEDESTCVVYGMPKSVADAGYVDCVVPLPRIAAEIVRACSSPIGKEASLERI